jgi:hypothetical protein
MYGAHGAAFTFGVAAALMAVMGLVVAAMLRGDAAAAAD